MWHVFRLDPCEAQSLYAFVQVAQRALGVDSERCWVCLVRPLHHGQHAGCKLYRICERPDCVESVGKRCHASPADEADG